MSLKLNFSIFTSPSSQYSISGAKGAIKSRDINHGSFCLRGGMQGAQQGPVRIGRPRSGREVCGVGNGEMAQFRKSFGGLFKDETGSFVRVDLDYCHLLELEFARFKNLTFQWAMHPSERDARWAHQVIHKELSPAILVEISCTRSAAELLGARKAYHVLFHHSLEEEVAYCISGSHANFLVRLVSSYRYEGPHVNEGTAKSEAKALHNAVQKGASESLVENEEIVRILTTRSKPHLKLTFKFYKELFGKSIEEDLGDVPFIIDAVESINSAPAYFSKLIEKTLKVGADNDTKEALSRVILSRSDGDMDEIKEEYLKRYGIKLEDALKKSTHGVYRDALLSLV
ncbi:annexin D4-like [Phalaenopsis equestris]|uniref:annexin D4-like n=1 Tax=Phalaenopsis equestris TaxID=78828 RepID=UPI0009E20BD5|nr:annexin D4-like [Phalaenopsis equestris]